MKSLGEMLCTSGVLQALKGRHCVDPFKVGDIEMWLIARISVTN